MLCKGWVCEKKPTSLWAFLLANVLTTASSGTQWRLAKLLYPLVQLNDGH